MGLWETMRARTQPKRNNLDALFLVPSAEITLQTAAGFEPTGKGSVCYRSAAGAAFSQVQGDVIALIRDDVDAPAGLPQPIRLAERLDAFRPRVDAAEDPVEDVGPQLDIDEGLRRR